MKIHSFCLISLLVLFLCGSLFPADQEPPYPLYPDIYRMTIDALDGEQALCDALERIDAALPDAILNDDIDALGELLTLRQAALLFHGLEGAAKQTALMLLDQPHWCSRFLHNFDSDDNLIAALEVLARLHDHDAKAFEDRFEFCLAYAVVWDRFSGHHRVDTAGALKTNLMLDTYDFFLKNRKRMAIQPGKLPCELNVFVVGSCLSPGDRQWVLKNYRTQDLKASTIYHSIPWTLDSDDTVSPGHGKGLNIPYTLKTIKKSGGGGMERAYFTENVFRLFGIPAIYTVGQASTTGAGHAWVGVLRSQPNGPCQWDFDPGRYDSTWLYKGEVKDPTDTGDILTDSEVKIIGAFWSDAGSIKKVEKSYVYFDAALWVAAHLDHSATVAGKPIKIDTLQRNLLSTSLAVSRFNLNTWRYLSRSAASGKLSESRALFWANRAISLTIEDYADFTVDLVDGFIASVETPSKKAALFKQLYDELDTKHPDLVCDLKVIEGREHLASRELSEGLECLIYPLIDLSMNKTVVEAAIRHLDTLETLIEDTQELITAYKKVFEALSRIRRFNPALVEVQRTFAGKLSRLHLARGDLKTARAYERFSGISLIGETIAAYRKLRPNALAEKRIILNKFALIGSTEALSFLRDCVVRDPSSGARLHAFSLWALFATEADLVELLCEQKHDPSFEGLVHSLAAAPGLNACYILIVVYSTVEDFTPKMAVARAIAGLANDRARSFLWRKWKECRDEGFGVELLKILLDTECGRDEGFLVQLLDSSRAHARYLGIKKIIDLYPLQYIDRAGRLLAEDRDARVRAGALEALATTGCVQAARAIYQAAPCQDLAFIHKMVSALEGMSSFAVISGIPNDWYRNPIEGGYLCAVLALTHHGEPNLGEAINAGLESPNERIRFAAAFCFSEIGRGDHILLGLMGKGDEDTLWQRFDMIETLRLESTPVIRRLISYLKNTNLPALKVKAALVLGSLQAEEAIGYLARMLTSRKEYYRLAAIRALGAMGKRDCVAPLIKRIDRESGHCLGELCFALHRLTGRNFGVDTAAWERWWSLSKDSFKPITETTGRKQPFTTTSRATARYTFYGHEITARGERAAISYRIVFVLDVSSSMVGGPLRILKDNFLRMLEGMTKDYHVNVIAFSYNCRLWKPNLVPLSKANKNSLKKWIENLVAINSTNLYEAISQALQDQRATRIIVLTDGEPTSGPIIDKDEILESVTRHNRLRQVRIDTIALGTADKSFLEKLATRNGGEAIVVREHENDPEKPEKNLPRQIVLK